MSPKETEAVLELEIIDQPKNNSTNKNSLFQIFPAAEDFDAKLIATLKQNEHTTSRFKVAQEENAQNSGKKSEKSDFENIFKSIEEYIIPNTNFIHSRSTPEKNAPNMTPEYKPDGFNAMLFSNPSSSKNLSDQFEKMASGSKQDNWSPRALKFEEAEKTESTYNPFGNFAIAPKDIGKWGVDDIFTNKSNKGPKHKGGVAPTNMNNNMKGGKYNELASQPIGSN